ncbi:TPA: cbb3-type cytochrome oxidase subunit 3 [Neisseria gonorrhoeae]
MDINGIRALFTVWIFICFLLVLYIVFNRRNKKNYDDAANSIFAEKQDAQDKKSENR